MDVIKITGKILFEPENKTKKHVLQSSWKKIAMVQIDGDICQYYSWFIKRRYNLELNKPLRGAHISFINDSMQDLTQNGLIPVEEAESKWEEIKSKWDGKEVSIILDVSPRTDANHWWMNVVNRETHLLQDIRNEIGLSKPFYGLHMSLGYVTDKNLEHSNYIHRTIKRFEL